MHFDALYGPLLTAAFDSKYLLYCTVRYLTIYTVYSVHRFAVQRSAGSLAAVQSGVVLHESSVLPDHAQEER